MRYIDPMTYFNTDCEEYYRESIERAICEGVSLKEAGKKIILFIADIIDWIVKWCRKIIDWVKGLFTGKKKPKSAEQILVELGVVSQSDVNSGKIVIPKSDNSTVEPMQVSEIDFALKPIMTGFKDDGSIEITFKHVVNSIVDNSYDGKIKGQNSGLTGVPKFFHGLYKMGYGRPLLALYFIKNVNNTQAYLLAHCEILSKGTTVEKTVEHQDFIDRVWAEAHEFVKEAQNGCNVKISELEKFGQTLAKCSELLRKFDEGTAGQSKEAYTSASKTSNILAELQYGLNDITKSLRGVYVMAPTHCNTIRDVSVLSVFSERMINAGIPSKYIGFNIYMASHGDIKGEGSPDKPVWGQSRLTLFPLNKNIVYKVALNGTGVRSNSLESSSWAQIKSSQYAEWFAGVNAITKNRCVLEMEKVDVEKKGELHKAAVVDDVRKKVNDICHELNLSNDLSTDIHVGNLGWKNNHVCIIDYGNGVSNIMKVN